MMVHQQISKAIGTHGFWKSRLIKAIDEGKSDVTVSVAAQDNQCDFGKWLSGRDLPPQAKNSPHYDECRNLHRQFHVAASKVLMLALAHKKQEATNAIAMNSEFVNASSALTTAMMAWDKADGQIGA